LYFARVMMRLFPQLEWHLPLGGKSVVEFGQPVLRGFRNKAVLAPVHTATGYCLEDRGRGSRSAQTEEGALKVWSTHLDGAPD
jgi:hypothetical protein